MERAVGIGGVFFRAAEPETLLRWYAERLGIELEEFGGAIFKSGGSQTVWAIFPSGTEYFGRPDQQLMVSYRVDDLDAMLDQLRQANVAVDERIEESEQGRFAWATDPEGNRFELWEPPTA